MASRALNHARSLVDLPLEDSSDYHRDTTEHESLFEQSQQARRASERDSTNDGNAGHGLQWEPPTSHKRVKPVVHDGCEDDDRELLCQKESALAQRVWGDGIGSATHTVEVADDIVWDTIVDHCHTHSTLTGSDTPVRENKDLCRAGQYGAHSIKVLDATHGDEEKDLASGERLAELIDELVVPEDLPRVEIGRASCRERVS